MENFNWLSFLIQVLLYWIFFRLGQAYMLKSIAKDLVDNLKSKGVEIKLDKDGELLIEREMILVVEKVGINYYAYTDSGEFIAQGADFEMLFTSIKTRFPDQSFKVSKDQDKLSEEEIKSMTASIFKIFGGKNDTNQTRQRLG